MSRGVRDPGQACRIWAHYNLLLAAISTVPVIATGTLAWQFALDGQKLKGILLLHLVLGRPPRRQCIERRLPWNSGSTLRRCGCAPRDRHGGSASHRCSARAHEAVSATRMVPGRNRTPELCRYRTGNGSFISRSCESEDTAQTWEGLLRTGDSAWGARKRHGNRRIVRLARCRHERFATQIPNDRIQAMDAQCARALVAGALVGICNIRSLVRPALVSEMNSRSLFSCCSDLKRGP
jgi:hypothetical protein